MPLLITILGSLLASKIDAFSVYPYNKIFCDKMLEKSEFPLIKIL